MTNIKQRAKTLAELSRNTTLFVACVFSLVTGGTASVAQQIPKSTPRSTPSDSQLKRLLLRFPAADLNQDGKLTWSEVNRFQRTNGARNPRQVGVKTEFDIHQGWLNKEFPATAVSNQTPVAIETIWNEITKGQNIPVFTKPKDGGLRIAGIGHSFMAPGYNTLPTIAKTAGIKQVLYTHIGGGVTGSARYKWEQENGIFGFEGQPYPKMLAALSKGEWDAMVFGPYFHDRPEFFECWIDFCLKHQPDMKFFISDAWPQLSQFQENPKSEDVFTTEVLERLGRERSELSGEVLTPLGKKYPKKIFVLPTSDAMVLAAKAVIQDELPGIDGIHRVIGGKENSIWRDQLGHLGPGLEWLEGYVFFSTIYQRPAPSGVEIEPDKKRSAISKELDEKFRSIAWEAVSNHAFSGVK
jgi:hypothetical protein